MGREFILDRSYKLWEVSTHDAIQLIDTVESLNSKDVQLINYTVGVE